MINRKKIIAGVVVVMFFAWTNIAQARGHNGMKKNGPRTEVRGPSEEQIQKMEKNLGITEDQSLQLRSHREGHQIKMESLMKQMKEKREALKQELEKADTDQASVEVLSAELKNVQAQMVDERINGISEVKSILTPEQFEEFKGKMNKKERFRKEKSWKKGDAEEERMPSSRFDDDF
ncbi:MAG: Spy/CpxP family protein refolding chaperone [Candidatus Omnitrophica bacterium]|nr:Spy/CpxP family protein refolding chaperone [Candidatus Omnitrophota bacterium]